MGTAPAYSDGITIPPWGRPLPYLDNNEPEPAPPVMPSDPRPTAQRFLSHDSFRNNIGAALDDLGRNQPSPTMTAADDATLANIFLGTTSEQLGNLSITQFEQPVRDEESVDRRKMRMLRSFDAPSNSGSFAAPEQSRQRVGPSNYSAVAFPAETQYVPRIL